MFVYLSTVYHFQIRKRPFEGSDGWTQYAHMATRNDPRNIYHEKEPEMFQNNASPIQITNSFKYSAMISKQVPYCPTNSYNGGEDVRNPNLLLKIISVKLIVN